MEIATYTEALIGKYLNHIILEFLITYTNEELNRISITKYVKTKSSTLPIIVKKPSISIIIYPETKNNKYKTYIINHIKNTISTYERNNLDLLLERISKYVGKQITRKIKFAWV